MNRGVVLLAACGLFAAASGAARGEARTWTGTISDSMCGASHAAMRSHGEKITDRECTVACVSYQTPDAPKYVFVSGGKVYPIANQRFAGLGRRAGDPIVLTGDIDSGGAITITKIDAAAKK